MTFETGVFHEVHTSSLEMALMTYMNSVVGTDNNMSTNSPTDAAWGKKSKIPEDVYYYEYERKYPHHGTGTWVLF